MKQIDDIILRSLIEILSQEDEYTLSLWLEADTKHRELYERLTNGAYISGRLDDYSKIAVEEALERNRKLLGLRRPHRFPRKTWLYVAAAAILLPFVVTFALIWHKEAKPVEIETVLSMATVHPGSRQAELVLADGRVVPLGDGVETTIREEGTIVNITGGELNYRAEAKGEKLRYHTVRTPKGGEYTVTLSDGSVTWLNAMSELRYPVEFVGNERLVELSGEAYFEVATDTKRIFSVVVGDYCIEALGTAFNINAYLDERTLQTTLSSGSVIVRDQKTNDSCHLQPGQQLTSDRVSREVHVEYVDVSGIIAWTQGNFRFDQATIEEIFRVLKRWYDVDVAYTNDSVKTELFTGILPRFDNLNVITGLMEQVSDVKFKMIDNIVYISK